MITPGRSANVVLEDGTTLEYRPVHPALGVEVKGIDLAGGVSDVVAAELRHALDLHGLLLFPEQDISPADELELLRVYNDIADTHYDDEGRGVPGYPQIVVLTNIEGDPDVPMGYANKKGMEWHTDGSGWQLPPVASSLYALEVPATGGETHFVHGALAYEALPEARRQELEGMQATYSYVTLQKWLAEAGGRDNFLSEEEAAKYPDVDRPLIRTHPVTGRKALWFSIEEITKIDDMSYDASRELMLELIDHIMGNPHVQYVHQWEPGQLVHWDNRQLLHSVSPYNYDGQRRLMHQITGKDLEFAV